MASELNKLLRPLGESLDPVIVTALSSASSANAEHAIEVLLETFERTVGPYEQVLGNALRISGWDLADWENYVNVHQCAIDRPERYRHPTKRYFRGPTKPSVWVWLRLFCGEAGVEEVQVRYRSNAKEVACRIEEKEVGESGMWCEDPDQQLNQMYDIHRKLRDLQESGKTQLPVLAGVLANVLRFLRDQADGGASASVILGFCAQYGLNGPIAAVLQGRYGKYGGAWNINLVHEALKIQNDEKGNDSDDSDRYGLRMEGVLKLAPYVTAAILGHTNVVNAILKDLGGGVDAQCILEMPHKAFPENTASFLLTWAILSNQPAMVRCLVAENGFQFRWMEEDDLFDVWRKLHETSPYEEKRWMPQAEDPYSMVGMRELRGNRSRKAFIEKDKMFKLLIELGLPKDLLFPEGADFTLDEEFSGKKKVEKTEVARYEKWEELLPMTAKFARSLVFQACMTYNSVQPLDATEDDYYPDDEDEYGESSQQSKKVDDLTLHVHEYYQNLLEYFDKQESKQPARLPDYEVKDPRWVSNDNYVRKEFDEDDCAYY